MGGFANLYWPGIESSDRPLGGAPGFESDSKLWADWIAAMHDHHHEEAARRACEIGLEPLLCATTDGGETKWTTPNDLKTAAQRALSILESAADAMDELLSDDDAIEALSSRELNEQLHQRVRQAMEAGNAGWVDVWFGLFPGDDQTIEEMIEWLVSDLKSVARNASWAEAHGIQQVSMQVNW